MKRILLAVALAISAPAFVVEAADAVPKANEAATSNELKVGVKGMVCAFCAQGIEKKFKAHDEVESVKVSLENKFVKLKFKEGKRLSNEKIVEILKDAGYDTDFGG